MGKFVGPKRCVIWGHTQYIHYTAYIRGCNTRIYHYNFYVFNVPERLDRNYAGQITVIYGDGKSKKCFNIPDIEKLKKEFR